MSFSITRVFSCHTCVAFCATRDPVSTVSTLRLLPLVPSPSPTTPPLLTIHPVATLRLPSPAPPSPPTRCPPCPHHCVDRKVHRVRPAQVRGSVPHLQAQSVGDPQHDRWITGAGDFHRRCQPPRVHGTPHEAIYAVVGGGGGTERCTRGGGEGGGYGQAFFVERIMGLSSQVCADGRACCRRAHTVFVSSDVRRDVWVLVRSVWFTAGLARCWPPSVHGTAREAIDEFVGGQGRARFMEHIVKLSARWWGSGGLRF